MESETAKPAHAKEAIVLYLLHCGLDGKLLERICRRHGLHVQIHQFPREELFAYHMHLRRKAPDLILIRGHFIPLVHDLDKERHIPYVVVSSKLKYGSGQPVFIHAQSGYETQDQLALYHRIADTLAAVVQGRAPGAAAESDAADSSREPA
jgi:hypothetical protein